MISRFLPKRKLTFYEVELIPEALFQLFVARLKVSFLSSVKYLKPGDSAAFSAPDVDKMDKARIIAGIIEGLSHRTPWKSTCLVKALAARWMLQKRGIGHVLHFGVAQKPDKTFEAHAWLSVNGEVILGGGNLEKFKEIKRLY